MPKEAITEEESKTVAGEPPQTMTKEEFLLFCVDLAENIVEDGGLEKFLQENPEHAQSMLTALQEVNDDSDIMNLASKLSKVPVMELEGSHDKIETFCLELIGQNNTNDTDTVE